MILKEEII